MHDRPRLRALALSDGASIRGIARTESISRNAVRRALRPGSRDRYYRHSEIDDYAEAVADVLADYPHMTVADIAVLVDWRRSRRRLSDLVATLRPHHAGEPAASAIPITSIRAGALATVGDITTGRLRL